MPLHPVQRREDEPTQSPAQHQQKQDEQKDRRRRGQQQHATAKQYDSRETWKRAAATGRASGPAIGTATSISCARLRIMVSAGAIGEIVTRRPNR